MAAAMIYPAAPRGRRKQDQALSGECVSFGIVACKLLDAVLARSWPITEAILAGGETLDSGRSTYSA